MKPNHRIRSLFLNRKHSTEHCCCDFESSNCGTVHGKDSCGCQWSSQSSGCPGFLWFERLNRLQAHCCLFDWWGRSWCIHLRQEGLRSCWFLVTWFLRWLWTWTQATQTGFLWLNHFWFRSSHATGCTAFRQRWPRMSRSWRAFLSTPTWQSLFQTYALSCSACRPSDAFNSLHLYSLVEAI